MEPVVVGYKEKAKNLSVRIEAHKQFSTFSLEEWLDANFAAKKGDITLDLGCGDGNLFQCYSKHLGSEGVIVGVDKSRELLLKAAKRKIATPVIFLEWDMNNRFPLADRGFDFCVSAFAVYYADSAKAITLEIERVLKPAGEVFLIGPTNNNARELYEFNKKVFNFERDERADIRTARLEKEFYPVVSGIFKNAAASILPSKLKFPDKKEFIKYYMATLLFEESVKKSGFKPDENYLYAIDAPSFEISKEIVVLRATKAGSRC